MCVKNVGKQIRFFSGGNLRVVYGVALSDERAVYFDLNCAEQARWGCEIYSLYPSYQDPPPIKLLSSALVTTPAQFTYVLRQIYDP